MSITGLSSDKDGTIVYDGEKFVVTNPSAIPDDFDPGDIPVVGLPQTHSASSDSTDDADSTGGADSTTQQTHSKEQSSDQESSSDSDEESDTGSDKRKKKRKPKNPAPSQPPAPDIPPDIEWTPEDEASRLDTILHADGAKRDSSDDATQRLCEALYAANPAGVCSFLKFMTGAEPDDKEQDPVVDLVTLARSVGLVERFDSEPWYTTKLGPSEPVAALAAAEAPVTDQAQVPAEAGDSEAPELNRRLRYSLTESFPGEWEASLAEKEDLDNILLIPKLKRFIHNFDEASVNWDDLTLEESIDFYLRQIAGELHTLSKSSAVSNEYFQELQAEYAWAADLQALAKPIPLDDAAAYAEVFDVGAEGERSHVQNQLAVIYKHLDIAPADYHFESQSTSDLKYELYSLLIHNVIPLRGSDQDPEAAQLFRSYSKVAGVSSPQEAVDRLQGTYRQPDVLGFLFVMGLTMLVEPVDWVLTTVDVINALSEGDVESAVGNFILGVVPFASSKMDDAFDLLSDLGSARRGGQADIAGLLPARTGSTLLARDELRRLKFSDEAIEMFENRGATGPGTGASVHGKWTGDRSKRGRDFRDEGSGEGIKKQNENAEILREQYEYSIVEQPDDDQLREIGYIGRTDVEGSPIFSDRRPDYIIEGRAFDHYAPIVEDPQSAVNNIWSTVGQKVPRQTDRLVIDLSNTSLSPERLIDELNEVGLSKNSFIDPGFEDLKEVLIMKDGVYVGTWVNPQI